MVLDSVEIFSDVLKLRSKLSLHLALMLLQWFVGLGP